MEKGVADMDYRATLNLPQTNFKMKANLFQKEPEFLKQWQEENIYAQIQTATKNKPLYILHDGPPYANGHIHLGTAFNKVLKDIILKSKRMAGYHCPYVPGWDCHGLPIEHNVDKELGPRKKDIPILSIRGACRKYAEKWIKIQKDEFRRLGVLGDWEHPYLTINYDYEAAIAREFNRFLLSDGVIRSKKPVYWCSSCKTALAEAEVEYHDHSSPSIYVKFPVHDDLGQKVPELAREKLAGKKMYALIWTTTPWTLPANLAVAFHPEYTYAAVAVDEEIWLMAEDLVEQVLAGCDDETVRGDYNIVATFSARDIEGMKVVVDYVAELSDLIAGVEELSFREAGPKRIMSGRQNLKVTLGFMPDFTDNSNNGMKVDFPTPGKPAERAGIKKGDLIIGINGLKVTNIQDYQVRLKSLEPGQIVTVEVIRDGQKMVLLVQL